MKTIPLTALALIAIALILLTAGCTQPSGTASATTSTSTSQTNVGILYSKGVGPMPMLLATHQIDGYIAWQPFVSIGTKKRYCKISVLFRAAPS